MCVRLNTLEEPEPKKKKNTDNHLALFKGYGLDNFEGLKTVAPMNMIIGRPFKLLCLQYHAFRWAPWVDHSSLGLACPFSNITVCTTCAPGLL